MVAVPSSSVNLIVSVYCLIKLDNLLKYRRYARQAQIAAKFLVGCPEFKQMMGWWYDLDGK